MPVKWHKRKAKVRAWEEKNKTEGRLPYWNDRARSINYKARIRYGCQEVITGQQLLDLYHLYGGKCFYCKCPVTYSQACFDHMDPLAKGGTNTIDNICIADVLCNASKGDDSVDDFLQRVHETKTPECIYAALFMKGESTCDLAI